jgi:hypothetical protein
VLKKPKFINKIDPRLLKKEHSENTKNMGIKGVRF